MITNMFELVLAIVLDFLSAAFGVWCAVIILRNFGIDVAFNWLLAFAVWGVVKVIRLIFS